MDVGAMINVIETVFIKYFELIINVFSSTWITATGALL